MIKEILQLGNPILREKSAEVTDVTEVQQIIQDMRDTIAHTKTTYDFSRGIGLAAPQIGELVRLVIIEHDGKEYVLINPEFTHMSEEKADVWDGCLSFFEFRANVTRSTEVTVTARNEHGEEFTIEAKGDFAASFQHEIDHLNGILYIDRLPNGEKDLIKSDKA